MPIKKAFTSIVASGSNPSDPRTATFTTTGRIHAYQPVPAPLPPQPRGILLNPTLDRDLQYFYNVATGELAPDSNGIPPTLVLNLYRATDVGRKPVAERIILGQAPGAPYYALHATTSATSVDEFNALQITRRSPLSGNHAPACTAELHPKLDMFFQGTSVVATFVSDQKKYSLVRTGSDVAGGCFRDTYGIWSDANPSKLMAQLVLDEGWNSLDEKPARGIIRAKLPVPTDSGTFADPRNIPLDIAYMDFTKSCPQFVSRDHSAHTTMDLLVSGFLTIATFETRRASCVPPKVSSVRVIPSQYVPTRHAEPAPPPVTNSGDIEELLTCAICMEVMHNPVSLITVRTSTNAGCLHNFCGACIVKLLASDDRCPNDRLVITGVNDNRPFAQIIERFLQQNPDRALSDEDIAAKDRIYRPGQRVNV